jgi:phosphate starvation-inducible protein PhoH
MAFQRRSSPRQKKTIGGDRLFYSKSKEKGALIMSKRKRSRFDSTVILKDIQPLTDGQSDTFEAFKEGYNLMLHGVAGTGKSYLSLYLGLKELLAGNFETIYIIRTAVPTRDQGFLPGNLEEKSSVFEAPYKAICNSLLGNGNAYNMLKEKGALVFMTTSYVRGITLDNAFIIVEECQNYRFEELDSIITRCGQNCRIIFNGDTNQPDLFKANDKSGLSEFVSLIKDMDEFDFVEFGVDDIVRGGLVKSYLTVKYRKLQQKEL